jgi:hypothetical protein
MPGLRARPGRRCGSGYNSPGAPVKRAIRAGVTGADAARAARDGLTMAPPDPILLSHGGPAGVVNGQGHPGADSPTGRAPAARSAMKETPC